MPSNDHLRHATTGKWLSVVGIGEDGLDGLSEKAKAAISGASTVFGGKRHLALAGSLIGGTPVAWPSPFDTAMQDVIALRGTPVCVLASGDPFVHGVGATLSRHVEAGEMAVFPHISAFSLAAARLGWPLHSCETVSLHGRNVAHLRPLLHPGERILALTSDGSGPADIAALLSASGFGSTGMTVLEAIGGDSEKIRRTTADGFDLHDVGPLNLVALEVIAGPGALVVPLAPGLPDGFFDHDGQMTKREMRALTLSALAPRKGELLWDIGAGAGSVSIEWMLRHPSMRAFAIEADEKRAARIAVNAEKLGVPDVRTVNGRAPEALQGLDRPDAVFVGGGGSDHGVMNAVMNALRTGGRLVANAVTLEMETVLLGLRSRSGGDLRRISVSRASSVGSMTGWRPAMPVTQWIWVKP